MQYQAPADYSVSADCPDHYCLTCSKLDLLYSHRRYAQIPCKLCSTTLQPTELTRFVCVCQPPTAVASVLGAMVGQLRSEIDPTVSAFFRYFSVFHILCSGPRTEQKEIMPQALLQKKVIVTQGLSGDSAITRQRRGSMWVSHCWCKWGTRCGIALKQEADSLTEQKTGQHPTILRQKYSTKFAHLHFPWTPCQQWLHDKIDASSRQSSNALQN